MQSTWPAPHLSSRAAAVSAASHYLLGERERKQPHHHRLRWGSRELGGEGCKLLFSFHGTSDWPAKKRSVLVLSSPFLTVPSLLSPGHSSHVSSSLPSIHTPTDTPLHTDGRVGEALSLRPIWSSSSHSPNSAHLVLFRFRTSLWL